MIGFELIQFYFFSLINLALIGYFSYTYFTKPTWNIHIKFHLQLFISTILLIICFSYRNTEEDSFLCRLQGTLDPGSFFIITGFTACLFVSAYYIKNTEEINEDKKNQLFLIGTIACWSIFALIMIIGWFTVRNSSVFICDVRSYVMKVIIVGIEFLCLVVAIIFLVKTFQKGNERGLELIGKIVIAVVTAMIVLLFILDYIFDVSGDFMMTFFYMLIDVYPLVGIVGFGITGKDEAQTQVTNEPGKEELLTGGANA